ncbi:MAG: helix-hairpin-helix domain-containing protein [Bacteroidaceae bacterium]|nr:helix-hairpin-helix domain-containing protein [Bacteroidaceae bacterium]
MLRDWFFFPQSDRRAILLLAGLLTVGVVALWVTDAGRTEQMEVKNPDEVPSLHFDTTDVRSVRQARKYQRDSLRNKSFEKKREGGYRRRYPSSASDAPRHRRFDWVEKFTSDTVLDLNTADTLLLKRVPGIGSWRARRIVEFRGHLGGYSRVNQLQEIDGMPDSVFRWFAIRTPVYKKINLNRATADEMAAHPYLTYKQARVILRHKRLHGPLQSLSQLSLYEEFTNEQLERIEPYVAF